MQQCSFIQSIRQSVFIVQLHRCNDHIIQTLIIYKAFQQSFFEQLGAKITMVNGQKITEVAIPPDLLKAADIMQ